MIVDSDGWFNTGDIGVVLDDQLFVFGRIDDVLIIAGRKIYAGDIERHVDEIPIVRTGRVVAHRWEGKLLSVRNGRRGQHRRGQLQGPGGRNS